MGYMLGRMRVLVAIVFYLFLMSVSSSLNAETVIGEYHFEDCDDQRQAGFARHCLDYDITVLGDDNGQTRAVLNIDGHQTSDTIQATTHRKPGGLQLVFSHYTHTNAAPVYRQGMTLGWLMFDDQYRVTLIPEHLTTITDPGELKQTPSDTYPQMAE